MRYLALLFLCAVSNLIIAQNKEDDMSFMREYFFVELIRIPNRPVLDSLKQANIQKAHLNSIDSLHAIGKLVLAGPFGDDKGGGIFILKAETMQEAIEMCENDAAIKNKRLNYKIRSWWTDKRMFTSEK